MFSFISTRLIQSKSTRILASIRKGKALSTTCSYRQRDKKTIEEVTIIGGGTMGSGIAQVFAQSGFNVTVVDSDEYAQKCMLNVTKSLEILSEKKFPYEPKCARKFITDVLGCIQTKQSLEKGCKNADLIIEAVIEDLDIKRDLFKKLDVHAPPHTIFTSNTSSLSIAEIAEVTARPDRFMGLHFFNPTYSMRACEVITTDKTSKETIERITSLVREIGKVPVQCRENKETAGFIVNSLLFPYLLEAVRFLERGHASKEDIDAAMKLGAGLPAGPFELIDIIGIDNMKSIGDRWHAKFPNNPKYFPSELINKLFDEGKLGRKSGEGFYTYRRKNKVH